MRLSPSTDDPDPMRDAPVPGSRTSLLPLAAVATVWAVAVSVIALTGGFATEQPIPLALLVAAATPLVALGVAWPRSSVIRRWVRGLDLRIVVATQLWRVIGATFLFLFAFGALTGSFAWSAGIGDIATGVAALAVLTGLLHGSLTRRGLLAFTALGLGDFIVAFSVAAVAPPDELSRLPFVLFPAVAVPWFAVLHVLALAQLSRLPDRRGVVHRPAHDRLHEVHAPQ